MFYCFFCTAHGLRPPAPYGIPFAPFPHSAALAMQGSTPDPALLSLHSGQHPAAYHAVAALAARAHPQSLTSYDLHSHMRSSTSGTIPSVAKE